MDIVLRVKRYRDQDPVDYIEVLKRQKTFEDVFGNLSVNPPILLKRNTERQDVTKADTEKLVREVKNFAMEAHRQRSKATRMKFIQKFRDKVIEKDDIVYYNDEPLKECRIDEVDTREFVIDEYYMCDEEVYSGNCLKMEFEEEESDVEEDPYDSEDSNREDHVWNDYPEEESEEEYESKSSEYEDYEVYM